MTSKQLKSLAKSLVMFANHFENVGYHNSLGLYDKDKTKLICLQALNTRDMVLHAERILGKKKSYAHRTKR